jgi:hypothetical protein
MSNQNDEKTLESLLGLDNVPAGQKEAFLEKIGSLVIDSSVSRLLLSLEESEVEKINLAIEQISSEQDMFAYLLETYPGFEKIVLEEMRAFQAEARELVE